MDPVGFDLYSEPENKRMFAQYTQDIGGVVARTKALNAEDAYTKPGSEMWHLADVPLALVHKWKQDGFDLMAMPTAYGPEQDAFLKELRKRLDDYSQLIVCGKRW